MPFIDWIIIIFYILSCAGLAWHIRQKYKFFKTYKGFSVLLLITLLAVLLHNVVYSITLIEEAFFFLISLMSFGICIFSFALWLAYKIGSVFIKKK